MSKMGKFPFCYAMVALEDIFLFDVKKNVYTLIWYQNNFVVNCFN